MDKTIPSPRLRRYLRWLVRVAWFVVMAIAIAILIRVIPMYLSGWPVLEVDQSFQNSTDLRSFQIIASLASFGCALLSLVLAAILFVRKGNEGMALFISFYLIFYGILMGGPMEAVAYASGIGMEISILLQTALIITPTLILFCTFPNGRFLPRWSRWIVIVSIIMNLTILLRPNLDWITYSSIYTQIVALIIAALFILALYAQIYRFRFVSKPAERQQTKWVVAGLLLWVFWMIISMYPWLYLRSLPPGAPLPWWTPLTNVMWWLSLNLIPLSLTIAILRYRLFDIDVIIRRTLLYSLLTLFLGLTFFGTVLVLQTLFRSLTGTDSPIAIVLSTLTIAALFSPLRQRIQDFIDRRFYRSKYDAEKALAGFARTVSSEVEIREVTGNLINLVDETMQPEKTSLWLSDIPMRKADD